MAKTKRRNLNAKTSKETNAACPKRDSHGHFLPKNDKPNTVVAVSEKKTPGSKETKETGVTLVDFVTEALDALNALYKGETEKPIFTRDQVVKLLRENTDYTFSLCYLVCSRLARRDIRRSFWQGFLSGVIVAAICAVGRLVWMRYFTA